MRNAASQALPVLEPDMQIAFAARLEDIRTTYLHDALKATVSALDIVTIDAELAKLAPRGSLNRVAACGLRGEVFFAVPCVLAANPFLLGYYRLLLGFSEKQFYHRHAFGAFAALEQRGLAPERVAQRLPELCASLSRSAATLVAGLDSLSLGLVHELQLLTVGPSLRGSALNRIGQEATQEVFHLVRGLLAPYVTASDARTMSLTNDAGRAVSVRFAGDPDVLFTEELPSRTRALLSIEIKGGADASNVYNRIGEAEKSHLTQKPSGCREFWTIIRAQFDAAKARQKSPTTTRFYTLDGLTDAQSNENASFREELAALLGISLLR